MKRDKRIAILKIANMAAKVGPEEKELLKKIEREYLVDYNFTSNPFGKRYLERVHELIHDQATESSCVLCQLNEAKNQMVCLTCLNSLQLKSTLFDREVNHVLGISDEEGKRRRRRILSTPNYEKSKQNDLNLVGEDLEQSGEDKTQDSSLLLAESPNQGGETERMNKEISDKLEAEFKASDRYVENLIRNLDSSLERLASRKEIKDNKKLLIAILMISILNTISIIVIAVLVFVTLKLNL